MLVIALGLLLGQVRVWGLNLGSSGVLFVALAFGYYFAERVDPAPLKSLGDLGIVLFVYAIGLQAGGRFVRTLRRNGAAPIAVGLATVVAGALSAALLGRAFGLSPELAIGVFAGALTSTPALAAATEVSSSPLVAVAYGLAYPVGIVGVVLFVQLVPRWLRGSQRAVEAPDRTIASETLHQRTFLVQNPGCCGKRLSELRLHEMVTANISRIMRGDEVLTGAGELVLQRDDIVLAVGTNEQLDRLSLLIGPPVPAEIELRDVPNVVARDIYVTAPQITGRSLRELHIRTAFDVVITRVRRESFEFVPRGDFILEVGDQIRAVGYEPDIKRFADAIGVREQRVHETGLPAFAIGLVLGLVLGLTPIPLPGVGDIKLGLAGGPLFVGLLLGHFGRVGKLRIYVPLAARYLMRELGLVLFLVSAGVVAGTELGPTLQSQGLPAVLIAIVSGFVATAAGFGLAFGLFRLSVPSALGMTCGAMTSTPGLGAVSSQYDHDTPALSYATVYPFALVAMTVAAQLMVFILR